MENNQQRLNILITAYWCDPTRGSEWGVGWNFSKNMARHHNVWVVTLGMNRKSIEAELATNPVEGLTFIYYDIPKPLQLLGFYLSHVLWQLFVIRLFGKLSKTVRFDIVHHVTFNQYRSPSLGFFVNKPFVMGPIGGAELINPVFYRDLEFASKIKEYWRNLGLDRYLFGTLAKLRRTPKTFIFSSRQNVNNLQKFARKSDKSVCLPAIAINKADFEMYAPAEDVGADKPFTIIYAGVAEDWKGILLFLLAARSAFADEFNIRIKLIGIRSADENKKVSEWIAQNALGNIAELINFMPREQLIKELTTADLSVYPAFRDSGSMSVLEACAVGCPVLCFDAGGQDAFPDDIIIKVSVSSISYQTNIDAFAERLKWAFENRRELKLKGEKARAYVFKNFTWQSKLEQVCNLYDEILTR